MEAADNVCFKCYQHGHFSHDCQSETNLSLSRATDEQQQGKDKRESAIKCTRMNWQGNNYNKMSEECLNTPNLFFKNKHKNGSINTPDSMKKYFNHQSPQPQDLAGIMTPSANFHPRPLFQPPASSSSSSQDLARHGIKTPSDNFHPRTLTQQSASPSNSSQEINNLNNQENYDPRVPAEINEMAVVAKKSYENRKRALDSEISQETEASSRFGKGQFQCPGCDQYFQLESEMFHLHVRGKHFSAPKTPAFAYFCRKHQFMPALQKTRKLACKICGISYQDSSEVKLCRARHKQENKEKGVMEDVERGEFGPHTSENKEAVQNLKCDLEACIGSSKVYKNKRTLQKHQRELHKFYRSTKGVVEKESGNVLYTCKYCGSVQYHSGNLKRHLEKCKSRHENLSATLAVLPQLDAIYEEDRDSLKVSQESKSSVDSSTGLVL